MIYLDFTKACDKVDHGVLLHKLKQDAREAMRVFFFCTYKTYLYALNGISYEYIQI